jgi:RNA polymerase sigma-70 factor (ECF subfamily)
MPAEDELAEPDDAAQQAVLERFAAAIERADASALADLLRADAVLEMPPFLTWFAGRDVVADFVGSHLLTAPGQLKLVPVTANGQAAFAVYGRDEHGVYQAHALQVLTLDGSGIARIVAFASPRLFPSFGLPAAYPAGLPPQCRPALARA